MRKHLTLATVLATLALFVSLSGVGIAAVTLVVSSNHQVAAHVISGAKGPSGDHKNLVPGSVGGADLANDSIGTAKLHLPRIHFSAPNTDRPNFLPHHTLLSIDGMQLGASCSSFADGDATLELFLTSKTNGTAHESVETAPAGGNASLVVEEFPIPVGTAELLWEDAHGGANVVTGEFTYSDAKRVIVFTVAGSANGADGHCDLDGTALPAPN